MSMLCLSVVPGQKKSIHTGRPQPNSQHLRLLLYMAKGIVQIRVATLRWENDLDYLGQPSRITSVYGRANQTESNMKSAQPNFTGYECRWTKGPKPKQAGHP